MDVDAFERAARDFVASRLSPQTRIAYSHDLTLWLKHCTAAKIDPIEAAVVDVTAFRNKLQDTRAMLSARRTMATLSSIYSTMMAQGLVGVRRNPFSSKAIPWPSSSTFNKTEAVPADAARAMLTEVAVEARSTRPAVARRALRDAAVLQLLYGTGMRRAAAISLRRDDVIQRGETTIVRLVLKGGNQAEAELPSECARAVRRWLDASSDVASVWLFPKGKGERCLGPAMVNVIVRTRAKQAEVLHVTPHQFRAAFVTEGLDAGVPLHEIQKAVHHKDPATTLRYDRGERGTGVTGKIERFRRKREQ